jgi:hypothetical protein
MRHATTTRFAARTFAAAICVAFAVGGGPAFAMGGGGDSGGSGGGGGGSDSGGGGGSSNSGNSSGQRYVCPKGFVVSADKKKCLRQSSGAGSELPAVGWGDLDDEFLNAAVLAHAGRYREAIAAFEALGRADDPYVLNYLGFSHRKLGEVDTALAYYDRALTLRPDYVRARQYLGEGYLALGRLGDAKAQLVEIGARCGSACEPYAILEGQIAAYEKAI